MCKYCRNTVHVDLSQPKHPAHQRSRTFNWLRSEWIWAAVIALGAGAWKAQRIFSSRSPDAIPTLVPPPSPPPSQIGDRLSSVSGSPSSKSVNSGAQATPAAQEVTILEGRPLLVTAVNPQAQDCVVLGRFSSDGKARVFAFNGRTGRTLWQHELPDSGATERELAAYDDSVLVRTSGQLWRLRARDGEVLWKNADVTSGGRLCSGSSYVAIIHQAPPSRGWEWTAGRPNEVKPGDCEPLYSTKDPGSNFQYVEALDLASVVPVTTGFTALRALLPNQGNARVVLGEQTTNGPTAQLGVVVNRRWVWKQELSQHRFATYPSPAVAAVRRGSVVVPYVDTQNHTLRLAAFALEQGKRQWDEVLLEDAELSSVNERNAVSSKTHVDVVISLDGAVFVRTSDGQLRAYSLESGAPLWNIGGNLGATQAERK